jgi:hypothetical protein
MYSHASWIAHAEVRFLSYPGPSCQKTEHAVPRPVTDRKPIEQRVGTAQQVLLHAERYGSLDGVQEPLNLRFGACGIDEQMHVFRHIYERGQVKPLPLHGTVDPLRQEPLPFIPE